MRYVPLLLLLGLVLFLPRPATGEEGARPPNLVILYADDAGYADFGFQPNAAKDLAPLTPHIDSIAKAGARFTSAYMSGCVCSPSRAGLMTGRYQSRFGHEHNIPPGYMKGGMDLEQKTIADRLRPLGYATGLIGKWHLGYPKLYQPNQRGFDHFHGLLQGARKYVPLKQAHPHRVIQENGKPLPEKGYVTDRFGDAAVRFIEAHRAKPFFLFVSFTAPHGPLQAKPEDLEALQAIMPPKRRKYAGLVKCLDDNVGKILQALDAHDLAKHTLVLFTNDNGGQTKTGANNAPLRGRKGLLLEGGIRVPMCVRWPGVVEAGRVIDAPVIALDLLPTFVTAAGGATPKAWALDGVDLGPVLGGKDATLPERPFFWRQKGPGGEIAVRHGAWKLRIAKRSDNTPPELYDLSKDVAEARNLADAQPERVMALLKQLTQWEKELEEPRWWYGRRKGNPASKPPGR